MTLDLALSRLHPLGDQSPVAEQGLPPGVNVDSFTGPVRVEWDTGAAMTPLGQLPFFVDFLKTARLFDAFVADCPLQYVSPNAPKKRDVLGTTMLSMLSGHKRYAHIAALRGDGVLPGLLDMSKIVIEDAVRRALKAIDEERGSRVAAASSRLLHGAASCRAVDTGHRHDGEAALWPLSRRSGGRL